MILSWVKKRQDVDSFTSMQRKEVNNDRELGSMLRPWTLRSVHDSILILRIISNSNK